jgi:hypothetical protein
MAAKEPTLKPDNRKVRTYPKYYADTDTESEGEAQEGVETEEPEEVANLDDAQRLRFNRDYMDEQLKIPSTDKNGWSLQTKEWKTANSTNVVLIKKPTASYLNHQLLNPYIYRNIKQIDSLDAMAKLLGAPEDWQAKYEKIVQDGYILDKMRRFNKLPENTSESDIRAWFVGVVENIACFLKLGLDSSTETKIIVGGILAVRSTQQD